MTSGGKLGQPGLQSRIQGYSGHLKKTLAKQRENGPRAQLGRKHFPTLYRSLGLISRTPKKKKRRWREEKEEEEEKEAEGGGSGEKITEKLKWGGMCSDAQGALQSG